MKDSDHSVTPDGEIRGIRHHISLKLTGEQSEIAPKRTEKEKQEDFIRTRETYEKSRDLFLHFIVHGLCFPSERHSVAQVVNAS